jgi:hypothetical protein
MAGAGTSAFPAYRPEPTKKREKIRDTVEGRQKIEEREVLVGRIFS